MSDLAANITLLKSHIPSSVKLVAVSKTKPVSDILKAYDAGQRLFGENRVQELLNKKVILPNDIEWHLIGHLQSNKVKQVVPFISMIQSVDTFKLLEIINSEALKISRVVDCLLQIHIAREETKFGFNMKELDDLIESQEYLNMKNVRICGVMGMATFTSDTGQVRKEFSYLVDCFKYLKNRYFGDTYHFIEISMGMSDDYKIAIEEGGTIVRIGSLIFGERNKD
ncbi:MAG: YggS family pyridoxal phosphate-dependent enzyme [Bacteroidales bacterium]|nr:YggS family pyridoxal phosphate-dependent enzyme [Bacteroidales bacterium]